MEPIDFHCTVNTLQHFSKIFFGVPQKEECLTGLEKHEGETVLGELSFGAQGWQLKDCSFDSPMWKSLKEIKTQTIGNGLMTLNRDSDYVFFV